MKYKQARIINIPKNPKEILDYALSKSYNSWIDEKATKDNPGYAQRQNSKLSYEEAFEIILNNKPHWTIFFRNNSYFGDKDYWEFGGCNIRKGEYGYVFIWIQVDVDVAKEIIEKFNLEVEDY